MLNRKHFRLAALLCLTGLIPLWADAQEESLWGYADPSADICIYINTKQAEKAMEKTLWDRIQQDKNNAIAKKSQGQGKGQLFSTKDRDMEVMGNLRIVSMEPFSGSVDGIANITGDLPGDIDKLMEMMKGNDGVSSQMSRQNDLDFYSIAMSGADNLSGFDCMFVPVKPNQIQFRININSQDAVRKAVLSTYSEPSPAIKRLSGEDIAFACILSPNILRIALEKYAGQKSTNDSEKAAEFLEQVNALAISVRVAGQEMKLNGIFSFKSESGAAAFGTIAQPFLSKVKPFAGAETPPRAEVTGKDVDITIAVNISDAWALISNMTAEPDEEELKEAMEKVSAPADRKKTDE